MNYIEKNRLKNLIRILKEIYDGKKEQLKPALNAIINYKNNDWVKTVFNEARMILESEIELKNSPHIIHLIYLLQDVIKNYEKKGYMMYEHTSWRELLQLRSPFEYPLEIRKCCECDCEYPFEAIGDFADIGIFNCSKCSKALVGSLYAANEVLECKKGGKLVFNKCPKCFSEKFKIEKNINPYKYFSNHSFISKLEDC